MAQPYVGEIRMFAGNFPPAGWMFCEGALLPISENETLFQLIGTTYGGDGQSTFALPDLRGRVPLHQGNGFILAETGGAEEITLTVNQIPRTPTR
ncbi:tail fiber protein [Sphingomonas sp. 7/4-4]|uniref:phage tail protein n=1 Tax=Sphingomonas sp. 7/4-4 TaxID=3018446 RepID=UPI0022F3AACB|nr:tail fiber protein [Sphingomonas sp. 7/4-4]WBY06719.1 tail fiber protein [Sphingomonas sp. 7/4-4]